MMRFGTLAIACIVMLWPGSAAANLWANEVGIPSEVQASEGHVSFKLLGLALDLQSVDAKQVPAILESLNEAAASHRRIAVQYDPDSGWFDRAFDYHFLVRSLTYKGRTYEGRIQAPTKLTNSPSEIAESKLLRGVALHSTSERAQARSALDAAIDSNDLRPMLIGFALYERAHLLEDMAFDLEPGPEQDKLLFAALSDARRLRKMVQGGPDETVSDMAAGEAHALRLLGDYDGALALYQAVVERSQDHVFWADVNISSIDLDRGEYSQALAAMDDIVTRLGAQSGMAFHYNRAKALISLKRFDDAIAELTEGLKSQPDYFYAFHRRACAYAQQGRIQEAIRDETESLDLVEADAQAAGENAAPDFRPDRIRLALQKMREIAANDPHRATDAPCLELYDSEAVRDLSPLLRAERESRP